MRVSVGGGQLGLFSCACGAFWWLVVCFWGDSHWRGCGVIVGEKIPEFLGEFGENSHWRKMCREAGEKKHEKLSPEGWKEACG